MPNRRNADFNFCSSFVTSLPFAVQRLHSHSLPLGEVHVSAELGEKKMAEQKRKLGTLALILAASALLSIGCSKDPEAVRLAAMAETFDGLAKCAPASKGEVIPQLSVVSVTNAPNETAVRVVIYATDAPVEFPLPVYRLSAGRWLIGENDRAFLLDEQCGEHKLRDRRPGAGLKFPQDGVVRLSPGQSFEATFSFHRLKDSTRVGRLVYAGKSLPFVVSQ